ncbi:hypothetical protein M5K25_024416 [Dendrobium thyrsiflorum]|uniref:Uncharacterized protein n=1 Tax=Dendrobium thyrsiflorum TaxID=117978 RepID=A0ABD0U1U1_DENTH
MHAFSKRGGKGIRCGAFGEAAAAAAAAGPPMNSTAQLPAFSDSDNGSSIHFPDAVAVESHSPETESLRRLSDHLLYLRQSPDFDFFSDARIAVGANELPVHRCLLSARSSFFRDVFAGKEKAPDLTVRVEMKELVGDKFDVGFEASVLVIDYLYSGRVGQLPKDVCMCADDECAHIGCRPAVGFMLEVLFASFTFKISELVSLFQRHLLDIIDNIPTDEIPLILCVAKFCNIACERLLIKCVEIVVKSDIDIVTLEKVLPLDIVKQVMETRSNLGLRGGEGPGLPDKHVRRIYRALDSDDIELVKMLLTEGPTSLDDAYALHYAVAHCDTKITMELLDYGHANVNHVNPRGFSVLHIAAMRKEPKIIVSLLTKGARPSDLTLDGRKAVQISKRITKYVDYYRTSADGRASLEEGRLCIGILEHAEKRNPLVGEVFSLAMAGNDQHGILLYLENRVWGDVSDSVTNPCLSFMQMDLQNTAFTVQLGRGANIQLANAVINAGSSGATIQFGSVDFPAVVARATATPAYGTDSERPARRPHSDEASARHAHLKNDAEASSSGERLTRRQRRKRNAELRAQQQLVPAHPSNQSAQEPQVNVPTRNKFTDLKWVKRNSSTGELKKSFWDRQPEVPAPPQKKKESESLSARVYRVLKTVKERGLTKRKVQRPLRVEARRAPPKERLSVTTRIREGRYTPRGEHRGVTPEHRVQGSTAERSWWKGKQIWRPRPHRDEERKEREIDLGVTSGVASRRSAPNSRDHRRWVQKKTHDDIHSDGRHFGKSSREFRHPTTPPKEKVNFDRSPRVEEILLPNEEPEIQWRRRSEIRVLEVEENVAEREENIEEEKIDLNEEGGYMDEEDYMEDEEDYIHEGGGTINEEGINDTLNMEVVYMVRHIEADYNDGEDDGDWQPLPRDGRNRQRDIDSIIGEGERSPREQEGENPFVEENITLADMRRQMRRQMRAKDREISQLNEKMTEVMAQMTTMMQMMQRTAAAGAMPNPPADPPNLRMPQVSGVRGTPEGGHETHNVTRQPTPQNIAITSSSVPPIDDRKNDKKPVQEEKWETAISKKTTKMLKQLEGVPGVKWKSPTEPVLNLKRLPKVQASTSKQHLSQASSSKPGKPKFFKKKTKLKKPKEKKTTTQRVIDNLDEYYQTVRQPTKLADFMSGLKIGEIEEDGDANPLPTEVCRVISVMPSTPVSERKEAPESCMMVLPMDCSSEEDLYFPEEDESDPDIASQMEHVNLGGIIPEISKECCESGERFVPPNNKSTSA